MVFEKRNKIHLGFLCKLCELIKNKITNMKPPAHHIEIAKFLASKTTEKPKVIMFRDNQGERPIPIGYYGKGKKQLYSTIGAFDSPKQIPEGNFEFCAFGDLDWLPNAIVTSIYWLANRSCDEWPLICEDAVKQNVRSTYRHMAFVPSDFSIKVSTDQKIQWLLGIPITDYDITIGYEECLERVKSKYPNWFFNKD
jgi:hypothetical protein